MASLMLASPAARPAVMNETSDPPLLGAPGCPLAELSGHRLLDRQLGPILFAKTAVRDIAAALVHRYDVPLSFIEASPSARVTISVPSCTLKQLLDKIVASAPGYTYGFVGAHLVLYSIDPTWQTRVDHLKLPREARFSETFELVLRLRTLVPALERLGLPSLRGNPEAFIFADQVQVTGPASVMELFTQLLGQRMSAVFMVSSFGGPPPGTLWVTSVNMFKSLDVTSPKPLLRQTGENVQLRVSGVLRDGTQLDVTSSKCGTRYLATSEVVRVSPDGLVTAGAKGHGGIIVNYDKLTKVIGIEVVLSDAPKSAHPGIGDHGTAPE
jgi:hypothetical protein